ncbi:phage portal protein [Sphingomonas abietis]|uniref:Phage portal protein n=1 Tax=Sphingomonas abietis TaxID=3012344 RepID=A0ABY7NT16_9SPHN|nr:phage portal protein [Sphingomonas abietis]WBO23940.1 phage portal protein [Sphingomonas abietis]
MNAAVDSGFIIQGGGDDAAIMEFFGGGQRAAGMTVTPETAMRLSAVWRCVTLIAGAMMCNPIGIYERLPGGSKKRLDDHEFTRFLTDEANDDTSGPEFIELQAMAMMLRGNGYAVIRQARNGVIHDLDYYHPARVTPYYSGKTKWYRIINLDGEVEYFDSSQILHFKGPGQTYDGLRALSTVEHHAQSIGVGLATRDYTAGQFERGLLTNDYFTFNGGISSDQRKDFKDYLRKRASGISNAHNPLLLENGAKWDRVTVTAKDAQLLELLAYSAVDVARVFGVPPHMIGETAGASNWGTGIEQQNLGFDRYSVAPHKIRVAKELSRKLFPIVGAKRSKLFVSFDDEHLMGADSKAISEYLRAALGGNQLPGWMSENDARRKTGLPPSDDPNADKIYSPMGHAPPGEPLVQPEKETGNAS